MYPIITISTYYRYRLKLAYIAGNMKNYLIAKPNANVYDYPIYVTSLVEHEPITQTALKQGLEKWTKRN